MSSSQKFNARRPANSKQNSHRPSRNAHSDPSNETVGLNARRVAALIIQDILSGKEHGGHSYSARTTKTASRLSHRDRRFAETIADFAIRRKGENEQALEQHFEKGWPESKGIFHAAMLAATAQILHMEVSDHAAVHQAIHLIKEDKADKKYAKLGNAVLRKIVAHKDDLVEIRAANIPLWLRTRWQNQFGEDVLSSLEALYRTPPAIDLTFKSEDDAKAWADNNAADYLGHTNVRLSEVTPISKLPGYDQGDWWVQDFAASLAVRCFSDIKDKHVLDACAAPGGKTMQLCNEGAKVVAADRSKARLETLEQNLNRTGFSAQMAHVDLIDAKALSASFGDQLFDAILLDAPCSATGTLRRHPDLGFKKSDKDVLALAAQQSKLLDSLSQYLKPGGELIFVTCSLEKEEGEEQVKAFLERQPDFEIMTVDAETLHLPRDANNTKWGVRILPYFDIQGAKGKDDEPISGMDGFFISLLKRKA